MILVSNFPQILENTSSHILSFYAYSLENNSVFIIQVWSYFWRVASTEQLCELSRDEIWSFTGIAQGKFSVHFPAGFLFPPASHSLSQTSLALRVAFLMQRLVHA